MSSALVSSKLIWWPTVAIPRLEYTYTTLVLVDVHTGWTECIALANKGQQAAKKALDTVRQWLLFPMLGLNSDNDAAFINATLARYCA